MRKMLLPLRQLTALSLFLTVLCFIICPWKKSEGHVTGKEEYVTIQVSSCRIYQYTVYHVPQNRQFSQDSFHFSNFDGKNITLRSFFSKNAFLSVPHRVLGKLFVRLLGEPGTFLASSLCHQLINIFLIYQPSLTYTIICFQNYSCYSYKSCRQLSTVINLVLT